LKNIAAIVLAAGASTRMSGRIKQLLVYRGEALLEHAVSQASACFEPVIVVVGAHAEVVRSFFERRPEILVVENTNWKSGMGSSISAGMQAMPECDGVAILLADQPLVTAEHLSAMRDRFQGEIVAARYNDSVGVPAIFPKRLFSALQTLSGEQGARSILRDSAERVIAFDLPEAAIDIDTLEDFSALP
jgi:molybdenum cofactor cytidylyltransferase